MKYIKFALLFWVIISWGNIGAQIGNCNVNHIHNHDGTCEVDENVQVVYICNGAYAYAYHSYTECPGLNNCQGGITYTDENYAASSLQRVPCCRCWNNVSDRCRDDNPTYSGGSGGSGGGDGAAEAYAVLAAAVIVASVAVLSNDIYIYPTLSFRKPYNASVGIGKGWSFGFRKTFNKSALEYGASFLKSRLSTTNYGGYSTVYERSRWGGHLNYVHQILNEKTPTWITTYAGPTINFVEGYGFGGIVGGEIKLLDRLKFDVRYELSTKTNQLQFGLIFNYQKRYFWQK